MSKQKKGFNPNGESTSTVAAVSYDFEKVLTGTHTNYADLNELLADITEEQGFPPHLEYQDSFYDAKTGIAGCAFLDKITGQIIIGYPGTNVKADGWKDIVTDLSLIAGSRRHVSEAVKFYERLGKLGYPIVLTGHSLGGNIAVLVALIKDNPMTVTYNGAPLSASKFLVVLSKLLQTRLPVVVFALLLNKIRNKKRGTLKKLRRQFSGNVIRFISNEDILNNASGLVAALHIGTGYVIHNKNPHDMAHFLNEDIQLYLAKIVDLEQHQTVYANIEIKVDESEQIAVTRTSKQLMVKNLLGPSGENTGGNGEKLPINPDTLMNLNVALQAMTNEDVPWIAQNMTACENKNKLIAGTFGAKRKLLNKSIIQALHHSGLGSLLTAINDSFAALMNQKELLVTLSDFNAHTITSQFDPGNKKWFKDGTEWSTREIDSLGNKLNDLIKASSTLKHHVEEGTSKRNKKRNPSIFSLSNTIACMMDSLEPKIEAVFKDFDLKNGNEEGISQALTAVFASAHQTTSEISQALGNISVLTAIENNEIMQMLETDATFIEKALISDDVKNVLKSFNQQVEEKSQQLSGEISVSYQGTLAKIEAKTKMIRDGMSPFKNLITALSKEMSAEIIFEENVKMSAQTESNFSQEQSTNRLLGSYFPVEIRDAIEEAKRTILPLINLFNVALNACQTFKQKIYSIESYLKSVIAKGVYQAFDLESIIQVQLVTIEVLNRMSTELTNLTNHLTTEGSAMTSLAAQINDIQRRLDDLNEMIQQCFGTQISDPPKFKRKLRNKRKNRFAGKC